MTSTFQYYRDSNDKSV